MSFKIPRTALMIIAVLTLAGPTIAQQGTPDKKGLDSLIKNDGVLAPSRARNGAAKKGDLRAPQAPVRPRITPVEPPAQSLRPVITPVAPPNQPAKPIVAPAPAPPGAAAVRSARLDEMIGQMLVFGFQGTSAKQKWPKRVARQLAQGQISGVLFLGRNVRSTRDQKASANNIKGLTRLFLSARAKHVPFVMVDQEGGDVARLSSKDVGFPKLLSPQAYAQAGTSRADLNRHYRAQANRLRAWGFNVNLAPVVDLNTNPKNPIIGAKGRSYSDDPAAMTRFASVVVDAHHKAGLLTALKHFPGHGSSTTDSHKGFVNISNTWQRKELEPFRQLINADKADMVMIGHLYHKRYQVGLDQDPGTFSWPLITGELRTKLGYKGVIITDDMQMGAIRKRYRMDRAVLRAVKAGCDLLIISNSVKPDLALPGRIHRILKDAALADRSLHERIKNSYRRILDLKARLSRRS